MTAVMGSEKGRGKSDRRPLTVGTATRQAALACIGKLMAVEVPEAAAGEAGAGPVVRDLARAQDVDASRKAVAPMSPSAALTNIANALAQGDTSDQVWIIDPAGIVAPAQTSAETPDTPSFGSPYPSSSALSVSSASSTRRALPGAAASLPSAVAAWFQPAAARERPLLYLLHSPTLRGVLAASVEATGLHAGRGIDGRQRGIFLNDASVGSPDRRQRIRPELPLWLAAQSEWLPYDPASAQELRALLCAALEALYVRGESGYCYLSAHDVPSTVSTASTVSPALNSNDAHDAFRGMYRLRALPDTHPPYVIRLCGAGSALANVLEAARWLQLDWGVACEVWSCPSYTRLAREAGDAERMSMLQREGAGGVPHLTRCLGGGAAPVLAVTGYARHIANQIGAFVPARFAALGSDDMGSGSATRLASAAKTSDTRDEDGERLGTGDLTGKMPGVRWIVLNALRLLVSEGTLPPTRIADATRRYGLF